MRGEVTNIAADTRATQSETAALLNEIQRRQAQDKLQSVMPLQMGYEHKELLEPCGLTVEELQAGLHYELKQYAADFLQAESDTGVNAVFLTSVAALESGWGRYCANDNNLYGWYGSSGYMAFESPQECISFVASRIKNNYLSHDGIYFNGYTVEAVNIRYNGRIEWEQRIREIMRGILKRSGEFEDAHRNWKESGA